MLVTERLKMFLVQEPVVAASCLISGLLLPAFVRPMLDSFESSKQVPPPAPSDALFVNQPTPTNSASPQIVLRAGVAAFNTRKSPSRIMRWLLV